MALTILGALIIGLMLGLLGSGGSILTVPVLVYVLGHEDKVAIAESLAIVGGISLVAMLPYARSHEVDWRSVVLFGLPGMAGTYGGAWIAKFVPGAAQLVLFAVVMLLAAWMMIRKPRSAPQKHRDAIDHRHAAWKVVVEGSSVGVLTGLVGVGGGFLIVPALVILGGLSMRLAVGTSLMVIALKSLSGFAKYVGVLESLGVGVDWQTIGAFTAIGVLGSFAGRLIGSRLNQRALRWDFAGFLLIMSVYVLSREIPHVVGMENPIQSAHQFVRSIARIRR
jgi:uncharacterized membrane protein YfcA